MDGVRGPSVCGFPGPRVARILALLPALLVVTAASCGGGGGGDVSSSAREAVVAFATELGAEDPEVVLESDDPQPGGSPATYAVTRVWLAGDADSIVGDVELAAEQLGFEAVVEQSAGLSIVTATKDEELTVIAQVPDVGGSNVEVRLAAR